LIVMAKRWASALDPGGDGLLRLGAVEANEDDAHEEAAGFGVVILLGVEDVAAGLEQQGRDGSDDPRAVGAGQGEHAGAVEHGMTPPARAALRYGHEFWGGGGGARRAAVNLGR
jgi:hypothetical protein